MPSILISGPAGSAKSQLARDLLREATEPTVAADFQSIVAALLLQERGPDGKFPPRPDWILPLAEYVRQAIITGATARGLDVVGTNSDGDPVRRASLLHRLGAGSTERIIEPDGGYSVVAARLADEAGELSADCAQALSRWYGRVGR